MQDVDFIIVLTKNLPLYLFCLVINGCVLFGILKNRIHSFIDPLFMMALTTACANSVPCFLYYLGLISEEKFLYFSLSEAMFWLGFILVKGYKFLSFSSASAKYTPADMHRIFLFVFFVYVAITLINYSIAGIPIFQDSRFSVRQNPLTAMLGRMMSLPSMYMILYIYYILFGQFSNLSKKVIVSICLMFLITFSFLSGSKGFILQYIYCYFAYVYFYKKKKIKISLKYALVIVLSPLPVISVYYGISGDNGIDMLLYRFVASGDCYWQGFGYNLIDKINNTAQWYERMFSFILGPLGLVSPNGKIPVGTLLLNQISPETEGLLEGVNSRVPLFTWALFRWNGIFVSMALGIIASIFSRGRFCHATYDIVGLTFMFFLYRLSLNMVVDPTMFSAGIIDFMFGVFFFNILSLLFFRKRGYVRLF